MESKLPKPSGLKRPAPVILKNILPTDRIKSGGSNLYSNANKTFDTNKPLVRDLSNLPYKAQTRRLLSRAISPEPIGSTIGDGSKRLKLRRSRSAFDLNDLPSNFKRTEQRLPTIPAQSAISNTTVTKKLSTRSNHVAGVGAKRMASVTRAARTAGTTGLAVGTVTTAVPGTGNAAKSCAKENLKNTAPAPATKRIAPYDFKSRFHDLLEKHKALKAKHEKQCEDMMELEPLPMQLEATQNKLTQAKSELTNMKVENKYLQEQVQLQTVKIDSITCSLGKTKTELNELQTEYTNIKAQYKSLSAETESLRKRTDDLEQHNKVLLDELSILKEQLFRSNMDRKELHNNVMDLRGNIRVFCRVRPPLECEEGRLVCNLTYQDEVTLEIQNLDSQIKPKGVGLIFTFDHVFHPNSNQTDIFDMVSPLIQSALDGYNICIFAYGQTGSGKTYTMDGIPENVGVIPRTVDLLFDAIRNYKHLGWEYEIKVTFLEIYNEVLYDLLSNEQKDMEIRMVKNSKNDIYVSNITEETVTTAEHLRQLMQIAKMNRATAFTVNNERSSRSHAVTKLVLIGRHADKNEISIGVINLVDLAGSESPKTSTRMMETKNINRSLSELTNVILALMQKQDHIPYRNSKLTHLLMPSLGGNSKTLMFINISPLQDCFQESIKSLRFASSVNQCKVNKVKRNRYLNTSVTNANSFEK